MNANQILPGAEYAYTEWPGRNRTYYAGAKRVRVLHVYKLEPDPDDWYARQRKVTLVECVKLDEDTGEPLEGRHLLTVNARQIVSTWEEHSVEHERAETKRLKREMERQARLAEERRVFQEREAKREAKENKIKNYVADNLGIDPSQVVLGYYRVEISRQVIEEVLNGQDINARAS
jgi:hypothetical protein